MHACTLAYWDCAYPHNPETEHSEVPRFGTSQTSPDAVLRARKKMEVNKDYFEGILQMRNIGNEVVDFAIKEINKTGDVYVANLKKVTNGIDLYISRQKFLRSLGNKLQNQFGGQLIVSRKLHTRSRMTGRDLYRVNVLFRLPYFKKGDTIVYKGEKIRIISMHKKVFAKDIKTGKKLNINYKDLFRLSNF